MDLAIVGDGRWVDEATVPLGAASAALDDGLVFPVTDAAGAAGFVFVGRATLDVALPAPADALAVTAAVPGAGVAGGRWVEAGEVLVALGRDPDLAAAAALGHALTGRDAVSWTDEEGREVVVVTALRPREAGRRAREALAGRARALADIGLDPEAMLIREGFREGAPARRLVELRPDRDLGPLAAAVDPAAADGRTWLTLAIDPTGLVDDAFAEVVGVHGPVDGHRRWRALGGVPHPAAAGRRALPTGPVAQRGVENVTLTRGPGVAVDVALEAELTVVAAERTGWLDVWVPRPPSAPTPFGGQVFVALEPQVGATLRGRALEVADAPFGRPPPADAALRSLVLDPPLEPGVPARVRLRWDARWSVGGPIDVDTFVAEASRCPTPHPRRPVPAGQPPSATLGTMAGGKPVVPQLPTGAPFPVSLRLATGLDGYALAGGPVADVLPQEAGSVWVTEATSATPVSVGRATEVGAFASRGMPGVRVLRFDPLDADVMVAARGILNFYRPVLGAWPTDPLVIVQDQHRPVVTGPVRPEPLADPHLVRPAFVYAGGGQLLLRGTLGMAATCEPGERTTGLGSVGTERRRSTSGKRMPDELLRSLAHALARGFLVDGDWASRERWFPEAVAALLRDEFEEEAFGRRAAADWARRDAEEVAAAPAADGPLVGRADPEAARRGAALLHGLLARIGEPALHRALADVLAAGDLRVAAFVDAVRRESGVDWSGEVAAFAHAGLRPRVEAAVAQGVLTLTADPPAGSYAVPVAVDGALHWVAVADGRGSLPLGAPPRNVAIDPEAWLPLR